MSKSELLIPEPIIWWAPLDEELFYSGLNSLNSVSSLTTRSGPKGHPNEITLLLNAEFLDDDSLKNLIGLMFRYGLDMSCLACQVTPKNRRWFRNRKKFWFDSVFGKSKG